MCERRESVLIRCRQLISSGHSSNERHERRSYDQTNNKQKNNTGMKRGRGEIGNRRVKWRTRNDGSSRVVWS